MGVVLVTGGAGNLGRQVVIKLALGGHDVRVLDLPDLDYSFTNTHPNIEVLQGDICENSELTRACNGIDWAVHLAAIMPPISEENKGLANRINILGTQNLLKALDPKIPIIFASSVATYGAPIAEIVHIDHPQNPVDFYGETKLQNEKDIIKNNRPFVMLRISGVSVPALLEIPRPWFFTANQALEFVHLMDAADAVVNCVGNQAAMGKVLQIAGGQTWQSTGHEYSHAICEAFDFPPENATFQERPGWTGWYDTNESQRLLQYQNHLFEDFIDHLRALYKQAIE
ncbi:MAG: NAD(P)-dependent oxidoreductase [Desulfobacterales bacterium]|jgi:nucleoside-diphosphate-sugar epimerase